MNIIGTDALRDPPPPNRLDGPATRDTASEEARCCQKRTDSEHEQRTSLFRLQYAELDHLCPPTTCLTGTCCRRRFGDRRARDSSDKVDLTGTGRAGDIQVSAYLYEKRNARYSACADVSGSRTGTRSA